ncbi:MAG: citramalate synthase [Deltaproteobacteria bacterium]|nr:citramalate synthase [Deltaproteobacteria bacterium]
MQEVKLYDTTLRDGTQSEDISFTVEDKVRIARKLDELGVHYIEGGWPGSNPKDIKFFREIRGIPLKQSKIVSFGSTARVGTLPEEDRNIKALINAKTNVVTIFGKSWDIHVKYALRIKLSENIKIISDTIKYLKKHISEVFFDAEHFFDGFIADPEYALQTVREASKAGADCIVLCDTNGGTLPHQLSDIINEVKKHITKTPLGIHTHNDSELAVANSILAIQLGISQVQGTINGIGERCGNANLCSIISNLRLKLNCNCITKRQLAKLQEVSRFIYELANLQPLKHQPFVGNSAFAHKGGIHVSAIQKKPETYEHVSPELVGNVQRVLISDLSGKSSIIQKAKEFKINISSKDPVVHEIVERLKDLEGQGFQFEGAEASFELLMMEALGTKRRYFDLVGFRIINERREGEHPVCEATIMVKVGGKTEHTAALGNGPVNALDNALRKALEKFYPQLKETELIDYKVRVLTSGEGTASKVRVLVESGDRKNKWGTVGVSENIIEASWKALVDSINYKLYKDERK